MNSSKKQTNKVLIICIALAVVLLAAAIWLCLFLNNEYSILITILGDPDVTVPYGTQYTDAGAQGWYSGTIFQRDPLEVPVQTQGQVDVNTVGEYEIRYQAEYEGVTGSAVRRVRVVDDRNPEIILDGEVSLELPVGAAYEEPGFTAADEYSGDLTAQVEVAGDVDPAVPGTYTLTYTVSDASGNTVQVQRSITYVDITAPVIVLTGGEAVEVEPGSVFTDPGYSALDDCDGDVTEWITVEGTVDTNTAGSYTLVYTVSDAAGNSAQVQRTVTVKDLTPPELVLTGDATIEMTIGNDFTDPGFTAMDNSDGDLTAQVEVTGTVNKFLPGTYTITYSVTDASGNTATQTRTVVMYDIQAQTSGGIIYLTYDDGPSGYTSGLLDVLDRYGVKATFFTVGSGYYDAMARAAASGHTIAIHSLTHNYDRIYASEEAFFDDLYAMQSIIKDVTGQTAMLTRFPGGSSNTVSNFNPGIMTRLTKLLEEKGFRYFDWNVDSRDAGGVTHGYAEVAYNVIRGISTRGTSVVLMHDSYGTCIGATERIIQWGLANGYTFAVLGYDSPGCHHGVNN